MAVKSIFFTLLVVFQISNLQCNAVAVSVEAEESLILQPRSSSEAASSLTILTCSVRPSNSSFISRWITPSGQIISRSIGRYSLNQGRVTPEGLGTVLAVQRLSYEDAGVYTCEAVSRGGSVSSCDCIGFPASSSVQLVLQVYLQAAVDEVAVTVGTTAFLNCEMSGYIVQDEDFLWFKGEDIIQNGGRFSITYSNGTTDSAQNGGPSTSPSRVSVLEIAATILSDAGGYICRVRDKEVFANVSLAVDEDATTLHTSGEPFEPTETSVFQDIETTANDVQADNPPPLMDLDSEGLATIDRSDCKVEQSRMIAITFAVTFFITVFVCGLLMMVIVASLCLKLRQQKRTLANKTTPLNIVSGDNKVLSAINARACVLDGLSVEKKN